MHFQRTATNAASFDQRLLIGYESAYVAGLRLLPTKPFFMVDGALGYAGVEPWAVVDEAVSRLWLGGPTVVKRVSNTLALMGARKTGPWLSGTDRGPKIKVGTGGLCYVAPLSAIREAMRRTGVGKINDDFLSYHYPSN